MDIATRQSRIFAMLNASGRVAVASLSDQFGTSEQTIRKDLRTLERAGKAVRVHGGAVRAPAADYIDYEHRKLIAAPQKAAIGRICARLIPDGATVFINAGTTTEQAALALRDHAGLRVITDNVGLSDKLRAFPGVEVLIAGGRVRSSDGAIVGEQAVSFIRQFRVDFALIGAAAIEEDGALLDHDLREAQVATAIIETARHVILAADHTKFGRTAPVCIGQISQMNSVVTDRTPPPAAAAICAAHDVRVLTP